MVRAMVTTPALRQTQEGTLGHSGEQVLAMKWAAAFGLVVWGESGLESRLRCRAGANRQASSADRRMV